jgi:hypothetical protein
MIRLLTAFGALIPLVWAACHHAGKPTPYSGGIGFPTYGNQNQNQNQNQTAQPDDAGADAAAADAAPTNPLVGVWVSGDQSLDIRGDGILLINGKPFTYAIGNQTLFVEGPDGSAASYPFQLNGDQLVVTVNNQKVTYTRRGAAPAAPGPGGAAPAGAKGATPQELVGKWCYMANVNASNGGRQSSTCFALNPDGSYQYHSESSSSGTAHGNAWGTASQNDDRGRWSAVGNTLTAHSSSGKVSSYTFEKKNHPKTKDPMLVIGGDAFVTYYQKPPW